MISLAQRWGKGSISLLSISESEKISHGYLERIFSKLKKAQLVKSEKGASGGYELAKSPEEITILEIVNALEDGAPLLYCLDENGKVYCSSKCHCGVTSVLLKVREAVNTALKDIKLQNLI